MSDGKRPDEDEDVEAQRLKESLGAGLAPRPRSSPARGQAGSYPVPSPPGAEDAAAELALIPGRGEATRKVQQAKSVKAKKAKKKLEGKRVGRGGRAQPT